MTYSKKLGDYPILVAEGEVVGQAILALIKMGSLKVCINSDSQSLY